MFTTILNEWAEFLREDILINVSMFRPTNSWINHLINKVSRRKG
jgi:hypothetical protein